MTAPGILFVPVSGPGGAGEFMRSLIIARALQAQAPKLRVHFVVNAEAGYARDLEFPATLIQGSPTHNTAAVNAVIDRERPAVVVFDSAGRVAQYRHAHERGARVVYVSSRFRARWKGFRLRRMRHLDQHWIAQPRFLAGALSRWERLKLAVLPRVEVVYLDAVFEPPDVQRRARIEASLALPPGRYAILCGGSGGIQGTDADASTVLVAAAAEIHRRAGLECLVVVGPNSSFASAPPPGVQVVRSLPNAELMDLITGAKLVVINGGSLLVQTLANRCVAVAVPVARDQDARIKRCVAEGLVVRAELEAGAIVRAALELHSNASARAALMQAVDRLQLMNGTTVAVAAIARLLEP
jgi:hypothetical protein